MNEVTETLIDRLTEQGWRHRSNGPVGTYQMWDNPAYSKYRAKPDVLVPLNPNNGDFDELIRRAHTQLDRDDVYYKAETERLRAALVKIGEWDCLNPPDPTLLGDLPWLRKLVDDALNPTAPKEGTS